MSTAGVPYKAQRSSISRMIYSPYYENQQQEIQPMIRIMYVRIISSFANALNSYGLKAHELGERLNSDIYDKHRETLHKIYPE